MNRARPRTLDELLELRSRQPRWALVAGGTDLMVQVNYGGLRPDGVIDLSDVAGIDALTCGADGVSIGAGVTFARLADDPRSSLAGLAVAARAVASPQIRSVATVGGNIATASPAGDTHPVLAAAGAVVDLRSVDGVREVPYGEFFLGPGHSVLAPDEVVWRVRMPVSTDTSQHFSKIGTRNAMVISVASLGLVVDWRQRTVGVGLGSVGPRPLRAPAAEEFLATSLWPPSGDDVVPEPWAVAEFGRLVASAATPIDDVRGTADYRRHTVRVMAQRTLTWALQGRRKQETA
ncbi:FAD binding domain-containing protein [Nocardioides sp. LHD-245]|uniref:FAD binding domain-containing protein n=1 Tax=Nocardioides sp. LHD-245 TaxID=3051387 RepID=UPI0027DFB598|nr:FAD binding domain-containing protein [Nocardioides sp. LHD-245]